MVYKKQHRTPAQLDRRAEMDRLRHLRNKQAKKDERQSIKAVKFTQNEINNSFSNPQEEREFRDEMMQLYIKSEEQIPARYRINGGAIPITNMNSTPIQTPVIKTPIVNSYVAFTPKNYSNDELLQIEFARKHYSSQQFNSMMYLLNRG